MTPEHLIQLYQQGKRDFIWADLRGVSLRGRCLAGANFNRAKLQKADLCGADLSGCSFLKADLSDADLTAAKLTDTRFKKANLTRATLAIEQLPASSLQGATLPDGEVMPLHLFVEVEQPCETTANSDAASPDPQTSDCSVADALSPTTPSPIHAAEGWAQSIDVQAEIAKRPLPSPLPRPRTRAEVIAAVPWLPVGFFIGGFALDGLVLYLAAASGTAWVISAIATQFWALHSGLTWFIPIVVGLAALLGGPIAAIPLLVLPATTFVMMLGGFLVTGWHWRTALHGATWLAGVTAILFCMTPWLIAPTGAFTAVIAPTILLAFLLIGALGSISIGLTGIEAMNIARISPQHQRWITGIGGIGGLASGWLLGRLVGLLA